MKKAKELIAYWLIIAVLLAVTVAILFGLLWLTTKLAELAGPPGWSGAAVLGVLFLWAAFTGREG